MDHLVRAAIKELRMKPIHLAALALLTTAATQQQDDPLTRPIAPEAAAKWIVPQAPIRVFGNSYLVGFQGMNVGLIDTGKGLILIDGAVPQSVRSVEANLLKLGYRIQDVKLILSTEPHFDHAGGLAALARDSGATVLAGAWSVTALKQGMSTPDDPQVAWLVPFPAVSRVRAVKDGEVIRLGNVAVTARATPGHTPGSMSWTWRSCEGRVCRTMVFGSSLNPVAADGYRFTRHPEVVASFRASQAKVRALPCDILFSAHPDNSGGVEKYARFARGVRPNPYLDPSACRTYAAKSAKALAERLADEKAGKAK
ncbi:subclass B3 metallo-beta-lactamase [Sphingomonas kyeonggiensis]|uniref:Metallo-beta-lactamase class B n=1 Tax=Sphingomonas kyeonggiensis TaxID=1268553 RepID=A0A7W6JPK8_9SPHN|nr:subclass B3 metallo-beta-lactamase [Sphingomonas kyeonggiensis]MBB4097138.1 metallo-beta-lactamase class B [Sphingomonas kyeonggiensis]